MVPADGAPSVVEAEKYVLSSWLERTDAVWQSLEVMTIDDFSEIRHEVLAQAIYALAQEGKPTDVVTVIDELTKRGEIAAVGIDYVFELNGYVPTSVNVGYHAEIVHGHGRRRALAQAGDIIRGMAGDPSVPVNDLLDKARVIVDRAGGADMELADLTSDAAIDSVLAKIGVEEPAFHTPWPKLTRGIRGVRPGNLYVIGARPGIGKSAIALQFATSLEAYGHVGFFTMEMPEREVTKRLIAQQTELAYAMIDGGRPLPQYAVERIAAWRAEYPGRILFDDRSGRSMADVWTQVRAWTRRYSMAGAVIDYAQLMTGQERGQSRVDFVGEVSRRAKLMAREFDIPVFLLSQLNRGPEQRADKMPAMSDLRESGSLEQDADVVILLHRDVSLTDDPLTHQEINFIIAKNRQGQTGRIALDWEGEFMRATGGLL